MSDKTCIFCDRSQFEERLVGETDKFWFIATLGQITDGGYVLIVPKRHILCIGAMREAEIEDILRVATKAKWAIAAEYGMMPVVFEHGIVGQTIEHAHLHLMPAGIHGRLLERIMSDFPNVEISNIASLTALHSIYAKIRQKYLLLDIVQRPWSPWHFRVAWDPAAPPQYLRTVSAELIGRPERANWRNTDPELDKRLWSETVRRLKPYFS